ncbi:MAG: hypothetical protein ABJ056_14105 [Halioglobus sp.]
MGTQDSFSGPINLRNIAESTIRKLAELVIELTDSMFALVNEPLPADDPQQHQPDISLAKTELTWERATPLRDGVMKTMNYFEQIISDGLA